MLYIHDGGHTRSSAVNYFLYPGGEIGLGAVPNMPGTTVAIEAYLQTTYDREALEQLVDVIHRRGQKVLLYMPYVPYARQDRTSEAQGNESLSLKLWLDRINRLGVDQVLISDPHSDVTPALLNKVTVEDRISLTVSMFNRLAKKGIDRGDMALVAPDQGAVKSTIALARHAGITTVCLAEKIRDMATGQITGTTIHWPHKLTGKHVIVADDICDGGRTFTELAHELRHVSIESATLYVTHGIFSKGLTPLLNSYDHVFSPYPWASYRGLDRETTPDPVKGWGEIDTSKHDVSYEWSSRNCQLMDGLMVVSV